MYAQVTRTVGKEGLVGLQKLEASGLIKPDFSTRVGNIYKRDAIDSGLSRAIARGIGWHSDMEVILEMIEWLRDGDYLIDYGELTVALAVNEKRDRKATLSESPFWQALDYFRSLIDDENEIFCVEFLLDYERYFSQNMKDWLMQLEKEQSFPDDLVIVKTSCGYSYVYTDDAPDVAEGERLYIDRCSDPGMHYNRYQGYICSD